MKSWTVLLSLFILGSMTYEVRTWGVDEDGSSGNYGDDEDGSSGNYGNDDDDGTDDGNSLSDGDDDDDDDDDDDEDKNDGDNDDDSVDYEFQCDHFNLEICMNDYANFEDFDAPENDDPLCWESYTTMQCLHDYAKECFEDSDMKEDYLCKIDYFQDRIQLLCLNETEDEGDGNVEEVLQCLEGIEVDAEECVQEVLPKIGTMLNQNKLKPDVNKLNAMKCLILFEAMDCTADRVKLRCDKEAVAAFREGAQEALDEALGGICKDKTAADFVSFK